MRNAMAYLLILLVASCVTALGQSTGSPRFVAKVALTNQGAAIPLTVLMRFKTNLYRLSAYYEMVSTTPDCNSSVYPAFQWVDESQQTRHVDIGIFECFDLSFGQGSFVIHGTAGSPVIYSVAAAPADTIQYNLYMTVEQLD